jgi:glutamine cyclotransferase
LGIGVINSPICHIWACILCVAFLPALLSGQEFDREKVKLGLTPVHQYRIIRSYPHDRQAFTQGLAYADQVFYEGTGLYGRSSLRKVDPASGKVQKQVNLSSHYFGEGITVFGDRIAQVTWRSKTGFVYEKSTFRLISQFTYPHEGWGIAHDGSRFIMSDGTSVLHFLSPNNFRETAVVSVYDERGPVTGLNELEYVRGAIYANVWPSDKIAVIDPQTGRVLSWIDLQGLPDKKDSRGIDVLNGIAYDSRRDRLFVTGKLWPRVYEIQTVMPSR